MKISKDMQQILKIAEFTMKFGEVKRATMHPNGEYESDSTH